MADIKRRQSAVLYSDKAARIALLTERATLIAGYHGEESVAHADALQLLAFDYYSEKRWAEDAALRVRALNIRRKLRSEEHTSELQSLMRISYAVFSCNKKNTKN